MENTKQAESLKDIQTNAEGATKTWVTLIQSGNFSDPRYGDFAITLDMLRQMVRNFDSRVLGKDVFIDVNHKLSDGAAGKVQKLSVEGGRLRALVAWTPFGVDAIKQRGFTYLGAEYHEQWRDNEKQVLHGYVLLGASLTLSGKNKIDLNEDVAVNFVGLVWRDGKLALNQGADCSPTELSEQCPYYDLTFPSGRPADGVEVLLQFQGMFAENEASIALVWALGAHLKAFLGYWPHFALHAGKGVGKTKLLEALEKTIYLKRFGSRLLQSEYRIIGCVSNTSQPVGWDEFGTNGCKATEKAKAVLQECYRESVVVYGVGFKRELLMTAPVLLCAEDVPLDGLHGKVVQSVLSRENRGPMITPECPAFPMREWLLFLCDLQKDKVQELQTSMVAQLQSDRLNNATTEHLVKNYAAVALSWHFLCEFLALDKGTGHFLADLTDKMTQHINEVS